MRLKKIVIEVDGAVHDTPEAIANDKLRDETLRNWGYTVLRFRNDEVLENIATVKDKIRSHFKDTSSKL